MTITSVVSKIDTDILYPCLREDNDGNIYYFLHSLSSIIIGSTKIPQGSSYDLEDIDIKFTKPFIGTITLKGE